MSLLQCTRRPVDTCTLLHAGIATNVPEVTYVTIQVHIETKPLRGAGG